MRGLPENPLDILFDYAGRQFAAAAGWRHVRSINNTSGCGQAILGNSDGRRVAAVDPGTAVIGWQTEYATVNRGDGSYDYAGTVVSLGDVYSIGIRDLSTGRRLNGRAAESTSTMEI